MESAASIASGEAAGHPATPPRRVLVWGTLRHPQTRA
jgi:hypothetical protein